MAQRYSFWIDRGGTFTDVVAHCPDGQLVVHKLLSENPDRYVDAPIQAIREILNLTPEQPIPAEQIASIKMGTTVATNALLERKGDRTVLVITKGFGDALRIGYQNRPDIFARQILLPEMLYEQAIEAEERYSAKGKELIPLAIVPLTQALQAAYDAGIRACAIVLMHGYRYHDHEQQAAAIAQKIGFTQISVSHQVSPLMKLVERGDTTVVDAYLSPILRRYVDRIASQIESRAIDGSGVRGDRPQLISRSEHKLANQSTKLMFMQSNGGLTDAHLFQGKDSILSGPAGGIVGAVQTSLQAGLDHVISFDMGGTSTDVAHYAGKYERSQSTEIAGVRLNTPMMAIHTVAAGGGSILQFDGAKYRVGPDSAGAYPGPASYRHGGPLTVTDANVMLGRIQPQFFPSVFGADGDLPLDAEIVRQQFNHLATEIKHATGDDRTPAEVAAGFLAIAIEKMATAIKKISTQRGHDVSTYTLCCFGGAGGQHACLLAQALGIKQVFIHPYAGVLSAYGMGLADIATINDRAIEQPLTIDLINQIMTVIQELSDRGRAEIAPQLGDLNEPEQAIQVLPTLRLRYVGTDSAIAIDLAPASLSLNSTNNKQGFEITDTDKRLIVTQLSQDFAQAHKQQYGFTFPQRGLIVEALAVEVIGKNPIPIEPDIERINDQPPQPVTQVKIYGDHTWQNVPLFQRESLQVGDRIPGPALIVESTGTNVIEPGWEAEITPKQHLLLHHVGVTVGLDDRQIENRSKEDRINSEQRKLVSTDRHPDHLDLALSQPDPVMLEIFNNLFRAIAEQMGVTLQNTSYSVNIKERLDFSCAIFDREGELVANAPHIPVHLGSMGESVKALINSLSDRQLRQPGYVYATNNPYNGGTHLPDITVITPVFIDSIDSGEQRKSSKSSQSSASNDSAPMFYVAARGHHADLGGITPGSMPPHSQHLDQEGVLFDNFELVRSGQFQEAKLRQLLSDNPHPARNPDQNIADLQAQIAANTTGIKELQRMVAQFGLEKVQAYMGFIQANAEELVRQAIAKLAQSWRSQGLPLQNQFTCALDNGSQIQVTIDLEQASRSATIDFTGTSPQQANNFNAPLAVTKAAILYVFRTLVDDDIPLNAGCLQPLSIVVPQGCMLNPVYPAAVVAGNVEVSQVVVNALYGALKVMAAAQGTMNNFTFGNANHQYYETICGGSGAGLDFDGTDAVQTHMTNSRLTDPEVLEWRFPVLLEEFKIRDRSGGNGKQCGGDGVIRRLKFLEEMTASILSNHRHVAPFGLAGGEPGTVGRNWVDRTNTNGRIEELDSQDSVEMQPGDAIVIETPGGGGYGQPESSN
ncbi:5-oxoprolinase (ATP-hydrolysing) [Thalassoporum mexicanum PCC 7367]|uniref:hydantoinase B/oxoprolinase family protein n=1 Tax=Thalassoporum mexicanum TaxID=3457544 RepID=UPI00029FAFA5|nr:hydantoinase B/oxoprolinase family protein [Pseudanabaena sp. PCC 7367]AFY69194.1 5-oxoprolinase (ATP-hydrolysing) [Pseudanabaena sp. PCC 7367]